MAMIVRQLVAAVHIEARESRAVLRSRDPHPPLHHPPLQRASRVVHAANSGEPRGDGLDDL